MRKAKTQAFFYDHDIVLWLKFAFSAVVIFYIFQIVYSSLFKSKDPEDDANVVDLKIRKFKKCKSKKYDMCSICMENFKKTSKLCTLPCDHAFHAKCIVPWFQSDKITCPNCRQVVPSLQRARSVAEYELLNDYTLDPYDVVPLPRVCDVCIATSKWLIQNIEFSAQVGDPIKVVLLITEPKRSYHAHLSRHELIFSNSVPRLASTVSILMVKADFIENCRYKCLQDSLEDIQSNEIDETAAEEEEVEFEAIEAEKLPLAS